MDRLWLAPAGLHIEPAVAADAHKLAQLHQAGFYRGWSPEEFEAMLNEPHRTPAYVACDSRRRIAGFAIWRVAVDEAELLTIAVERRWRGKGIGRALLVAGIDDLRYSPVARLFLEVAEDNAAAVSLYRTTGFNRVGERRGYYERPDGRHATALVMSRELG
ncbi:alanine acetyltransferase [Devosia pacifica]|uniref:Alanine acetyltransferase n=1 Tax=Devosia pacifica TaxID=1335967 RepID=A0A918S506_9HYPH|nr:ribosomal protein S18-alanine N-acetyltransferase [Devosia pacifica]GHA20846.1 alanine acetyltransferase [Devosia pacifica]